MVRLSSTLTLLVALAAHNSSIKGVNAGQSPPRWDLNRTPEEQAIGASFSQSKSKADAQDILSPSASHGSAPVIHHDDRNVVRSKQISGSHHSITSMAVGEAGAAILGRPKLRTMNAEQKADYLIWKQRMKNRMKDVAAVEAMQSEKIAQKDESHIDDSSKRVERQRPARPSKEQQDVKARMPRNYQGSTTHYVPPQWMGKEVRQYYKYWNEHADEVRKYNQGIRSERPQFDTRTPFVSQHQLELKERKLQEKTNRKLRAEYGKEADPMTKEEVIRDAEEWDMILEGENLRMRIMQLHRGAVAKELGIHINGVTQDIGRRHGVPYGPWYLPKKTQSDPEATLSMTGKRKQLDKAEGSAPKKAAKT